MELFTLNSGYQLDTMYENYSSLVWSERYDAAGDFELVSSDIPGTMAALPRETCVSLRESTVPMIVETYKLSVDEQGVRQITVYGRSFETVLERRGSVSALDPATARVVWTITAAKESDAAYKAIRVVIGDVARSRTDNSMPLAGEVALGVQVLPSQTPAVSTKDAIPEVNLPLPKDYSSLTPNSYEIKADKLYDTVLGLIQTNHRGLKAVRPSPGKSTIDIEIYNGADLRQLVQFDARFDQFDKSTYLFSAQGSTNVGYIYGPTGANQVLRNQIDGTHPEPTGLGRRVLVVDGSSDTTLNSSTVRSSRGLVELYKNNPTAMFDGEISVQIAAGYNTNYFLGDILLLVGEYGVTETVRVAEFIRTSDSTGEKAYPTFQVVEG